MSGHKDGGARAPHKETSDVAEGARAECSHTPGPWRHRGPTGYVGTDGAEDKMVASVYGDRADCLEDARQIANARLIAAAPDMLAALENVQKLIAEASMTGFNCHDGDWAERLFASQQDTSNAVRLAMYGPSRGYSQLIARAALDQGSAT